jgi:CheY-like chemotaxis protein
VQHVLVIEPDVMSARIYTEALSHVANVAHATSAQMALDALDDRLPDVIVLEMQLPAHNGLEFIAELRSYGEWQHIPIIMHTLMPLARFCHDDAILRQLGVVAYLYKPTTSLAQLQSEIRQVTSGLPRVTP